ncbi:MAG: hypothetical protein IPN76_30980 [Saprospiraceae bacterium]|nr:hypothetical protein [Saprospiraceae bacterium]
MPTFHRAQRGWQELRPHRLGGRQSGSTTESKDYYYDDKDPRTGKTFHYYRLPLSGH